MLGNNVLNAPKPMGKQTHKETLGTSAKPAALFGLVANAKSFSWDWFKGISLILHLFTVLCFPCSMIQNTDVYRYQELMGFFNNPLTHIAKEQKELTPMFKRENRRRK